MVRRSVGTDCGNFFIMSIIVGTYGEKEGRNRLWEFFKNENYCRNIW